uniref:NXPE C-terminal domain-containing protein n=1 Tax=Gadus morhua TaxID=8049 RepID=A0A8C5B0D2_GADMO
MLFQPQNSSHPALAQKGPLPPYKNHTICSHLEPTPDEALEDRALLDAIVWPKPPAPTELHVGDQLEALVQMQDFQGRPKHYGGDFLVARLHSPELGAGVAGTVVDHLNGSYSVVIHASGPDRIDVLPKKIGTQSLLQLENRSIEPGPVKYNPAGYYYKGSWRLFDGTPVRQFDAKSITQCLTGKVMNMYGDSTMRQWFEYLRAFVPGEHRHPSLCANDSVTITHVGPFMAVDCKHNILLKYHCHGPPIGFSTDRASELRYVANELDRLPGGPNTVVALSLWAHFSPFPVEVYIRRMRNIRRALERLLARGPGTLAVIRSANLRALDKERSLNHSDWFSLQLDRILRNMFMGLAVVFVDAWEMTLAHHSPHNIHPPPDIIKNMISLILTKVCPAKKKS